MNMSKSPVLTWFLACLFLCLSFIAVQSCTSQVFAAEASYVPAMTNAYTPMTKAYTLNPVRTVTLVGMVGFNAIEAAEKVSLLLSQNKDPIAVVINSPGGSVEHGGVLLRTLYMAKAAGVRVDCLVVGAAYSMGFNTLDGCTRVFALPGATFLFHPVRAFSPAPMRAIDADLLAQALNKMDQVFLALAKRVTHLSAATVKKNYYMESLWTPEDFAALKSFFILPLTVVYNLPPDSLKYPGKGRA